MTKGAKKNAASKADEKELKKKNALLNTDDESDESSAEQSGDEEADEAEGEDESEEDESSEEEARKKASSKKTAVAPKVNSTEGLKSDIMTTKQIIDAEPKVQFMIPLMPGEKPGVYHEVFINGYSTRVKKGVMQLIPRSVCELLAEHYKINAEVGTDYRLDLDDRKQDALT